MVTVDFSDFNRLAQEYRQRAANLQVRPLGDNHGMIQTAVRQILADALRDNEGLTQSAQNRLFDAEGIGYYGAKFNERDPSKVNPQEFIDAGTSPRLGHRGPGRLYANSSVTINPTGDGAIVDLVTSAQMQPYPNARTGRMLPQMPIMYYIRRGWVDPDNPKHTMGARPEFGQRVAALAAQGKVIGRHLTSILRSAGFRQR